VYLLDMALDSGYHAHGMEGSVEADAAGPKTRERITRGNVNDLLVHLVTSSARASG